MTTRQKKIVLATACVSLTAAAVVAFWFLFKKVNVDEKDIMEYKPHYFTMEELMKSDTASVRGINNVTTDPEIISNLTALTMKVLDPVRSVYGKPIYVTSGYRCAELNAVLGGANESQHTRGQAADITTHSKAENKILFDLIVARGEYDQLINEKDFSWIHVSYRRTGYNRHQILKL